MRGLSRCQRRLRHTGAAGRPTGGRLQTAAALRAAAWAAGRPIGGSVVRGFSTGGCVLAHPSTRKHGLPGEDAYFAHDGGTVVVIGVADGTSVAGASAPPLPLAAACRYGVPPRSPCCCASTNCMADSAARVQMAACTRIG
jgi:hypothetical protein